MPPVLSKVSRFISKKEEEKEGNENFGPAFRTSFSAGEVPVCVLGTTELPNGHEYHMIRLRTDGEDALLKNPCGDVNETNCVVVSNSFATRNCPKLLEQFYLEQMTACQDGKDKASQVKDIINNLAVKKENVKKTKKDMAPIGRKLMKDFVKHLDQMEATEEVGGGTVEENGNGAARANSAMEIDSANDQASRSSNSKAGKHFSEAKKKKKVQNEAVDVKKELMDLYNSEWLAPTKKKLPEAQLDKFGLPLTYKIDEDIYPFLDTPSESSEDSDYLAMLVEKEKKRKKGKGKKGNAGLKKTGSEKKIKGEPQKKDFLSEFPGSVLKVDSAFVCGNLSDSDSSDLSNDETEEKRGSSKAKVTKKKVATGKKMDLVPKAKVNALVSELLEKRMTNQDPLSIEQAPSGVDQGGSLNLSESSSDEKTEEKEMEGSAMKKTKLDLKGDLEKEKMDEKDSPQESPTQSECKEGEEFGRLGLDLSSSSSDEN